MSIYKLRMTDEGYEHIRDRMNESDEDEEEHHSLQKTFRSFLLRAKSEKAARRLAAKNCGAEGPDFWKNSEFVECKIYPATGSNKIFSSEYL